MTYGKYLLSFLLFLVQFSFTQIAQTTDYQRIGVIEVDSPYPLRKIDFNLRSPVEWELKLNEPSAYGLISSHGEYGLFFQSEYDGSLSFSLEDFSEKMLSEVRRRLNIQIDYIDEKAYQQNGYYGTDYYGKVLFRKEPQTIRARIAADEKHIILIVLMNPAQNPEIDRRMEKLHKSIELKR